jgi:hypothetical protein
MNMVTRIGRDFSYPLIGGALILYGIVYAALIGLFSFFIKKPTVWLFRLGKYYILRYPVD